MSFSADEYRLRYFAAVANSWMNARSLSFCLDHLWGEVPSAGLFQDLTHLLAHCFYLPTCISGPIVNFKEFHEGLTSEARPWTLARLRGFAAMLARYSFWFVVNELILHAFYFSALQYDLDIMHKVNLWTLCGIGFAMGQFFHLKYVVFYGVPRPFLIEDSIDAPTPPKCIARIHLYSDMWRYFDNGLYKFLRKYFYQPILAAYGRKPQPAAPGEPAPANFFLRLVASSFTFAFVYVWHGTRPHVLVWSVLNFVGITLEATARAVGQWPPYARLERRLLSKTGRRRFHALLGAPLFQMSIVSNFFFFMGSEVGHLFAERTFFSFPVGTPVIWFFMYCAAQTSFEMANWEIRAKLRQEKRE